MNPCAYSTTTKSRVISENSTRLKGFGVLCRGISAVTLALVDSAVSVAALSVRGSGASILFGSTAFTPRVAPYLVEYPNVRCNNGLFAFFPQSSGVTAAGATLTVFYH